VTLLQNSVYKQIRKGVQPQNDAGEVKPLKKGNSFGYHFIYGTMDTSTVMLQAPEFKPLA